MTPKKIACFVEKQTEQIFVEKLFQEIAGYKKISIETYKFQGGKANRVIQSLKPSIVKSDVYLSSLSINELHEFITLEDAEASDSYELKKVYA